MSRSIQAKEAHSQLSHSVQHTYIWLWGRQRRLAARSDDPHMKKATNLCPCKWYWSSVLTFTR